MAVDLSSVCSKVGGIHQDNIGVFADFIPEYLSSIVVETDLDAKVAVYVGSRQIECGRASCGHYEVKTFKSCPYPYKRFPYLHIRCAKPYTMKFKTIEYDQVIGGIIDYIGAYIYLKEINEYLVFKNKKHYVSKYRDCLDDDEREPIDRDTHVVIESNGFDSLPDEYAWVREYLMPTMGLKYRLMVSASRQNVKPCVIIKREFANAFVSMIEYGTNAKISIKLTNPNTIIYENIENLKWIVGTFEENEKEPEEELKYEEKIYCSTCAV